MKDISASIFVNAFVGSFPQHLIPATTAESRFNLHVMH